MFTIDEIKKSENLVDLFDDLSDGQTQLRKIGRSVVKGYEIDEKTSDDWRESIAEALDLAKQVMTKKNFPWANSANIKFPLICEAAINFAARIFPEIIPNDNDIVEMAVIGQDPQGFKYDRAERVSHCMSYQCATSPDWKEHIDRLLHILPVVGTVFTKTWYDEYHSRNRVDLCPPDRIVLNHDTTTSLAEAERITHLLEMSSNDIVTRQRTGKYTHDVDIDMLRPEDCDSEEDNFKVELLEQHCWLDLDGDGYKEPYVVVVHEKTEKVLRIVNRIKPGSIKKNAKGEIYSMEAINYFQDYHFIRSPDGGFYSMGFGQLLLPLNKAINTLINQLLDAGTLSVTSGGFLGKALRLKTGEMRFKPFEWKTLEAASGTDLKQNIFPFPVREPSGTLLSLLTLLINVGKELTKSTEAMNGSMSASNVAASTFNGLVEQGAKVFQAINKRFYDSLTNSFKKLYELNYYHLTDKEYRTIIEIPEASVKQDFDLASNDVRPVADPQLSSMNQRMSKVMALSQLRTADPRAVDMYMLRTLQFDAQQIQQFLPPPDPNAPPPPDTVKTLSEAKLNEAKTAEIMLSSQIETQKAPIDASLVMKQVEFTDAQIQESASRAWKTMKDAAHNDQKTVITATKMSQQEQLKRVIAERNSLRDQLSLLQRNRELDIKEANNAMQNAIELKKVEKEDNNEQE